MKKFLKWLAVMLGLIVLVASWPTYQLYSEIQKSRSEDPLVWEEQVIELEQQTRDLHPPGKAIVFIGSSSIRLWSTLTEDMAPLPVIQHGFGGAKLHDVVHYADRLVVAYHPRAVVVFAGTNDIDPAAAKSPEVLLDSFKEFVALARSQQADLPIFYIGITPSILRWEVWPVAQATNQLIEQWTQSDANLHFIDTGDALLGSDGTPDKDNYVFDGLHLSEQGYKIWTRIIHLRLLEDLGGFRVEQ